MAQNILEHAGTVILDTETTGLSNSDEAIQLSIIDMDGNILLNSYLNPSIEICPEAHRVHGITKKQLQSAPKFSDVYKKVYSLLLRRNVISYNAEFDRKILRQTCNRYGFLEIEVTNWECAMKKYSYFWGVRDGEGNYRPQSLTMACTQQGITPAGAHHATKDCLLTLKLITKMADSIE